MPQSQPAQGDKFEFLHLKDVEVGFKKKRPKYPVKIKVIAGNDAPKSKEFGSGVLLRWETDMHLSPTSSLEVILKESHTVKWRAKRDFASVRFEAADIGKNALIMKEDEEGMISVKLTFASPVAAGDVVRKEAEDATDLLDKKPVALEKLGKARKFIEVVKRFGDVLSDVHPAAKAAVIAFDLLYEKLEQQEKLHEAASDLIEDLTLFLPFTEVINPSSLTNEAARSAIRDFLDLFKETCESVVKYSSKNILGDLLSSQQPKINQLEGDFRKVKSRYDWCIKTDVWRATLKLEKLRDEDMLKLLQVSFSGPAGKEYYRTDRCCLAGTRGGVIDQVQQWAEDVPSQKLFWMHGIAGSGKSAIANSMARMFDGQRLLAGCFFCKRDDPDLRNIEKVIPSLAFHLSVWHQPYCAKLLSILQGDEKNKLASKSVQEQFELLIKGPALALSSDQQVQSPRPLIIVIDALDECGESMRQRFHLAQVLLQVSTLVPWLKLFVTSRPLPEFSQVFEGVPDSLKKLHLNQAGDPTADIILYTSYRAKLIAEEFCLESTWLSTEQVMSLTRKAQGLFIWTSTVFNFIQGQIDIDHAVEVVLSSASDAENPEAALDDLYRTVLLEVGSSPHNFLLVKTVAGIIFSTAKNVPLTVDAIHKLIPQFSVVVIGRVTDQLQAVLYKDVELENAIRVCHPSFIDFMSQETRSAKFWTRPQELDLRIGTKCLQIMKESLCFNICHLQTSYLANKDVPDLHLRIAKEISRALSYSCIYWMSHVQATDKPQQEEFVVLVGEILCSEISLYWLEVLSLLEEVKRGIQILSQVSVSFTDTELKATALDIFRFVSAFHDPIATSTPHIYISALAWLPSECLLARKIYATFVSQTPIRRGKSSYWPSALLTIPETGMVRSVACSPDGMHIASGTGDGTVCIRDAQTGTLKGFPIKGHTAPITSVAFSPDGKLIASSSHDRTIQICDVETGISISDPLRDDSDSSGPPTSIAFSPGGKHIVSGSDDKIIRIWDVETGKLAKEPIRGSKGSIRCIAVSPDGKCIVSGSDEKIIQIWNAESGEAVGKQLEGHSNWVSSVTYSPKGTYIVSGSYDKTVRLWDAATGEPLREPFIGHTDYINSVAHSPAENLVVSASTDKTIRIWDVKTGKLVGKPLKGHTDWVMSATFSHDGKHIVSGSHDNSVWVWDLETGNRGEETLKGRIRTVAFSPDGKHVASGSSENIIQLWDAETCKVVKQPCEGHSRWVNSVAFSPSGKHLVSGSDDMTIRIWDLETHMPVGEPLTGHSGWVKSVAFSRDGKKIVSGSQDKCVRVWDVDTGKTVGVPLEGHGDWVNSVAFSPDDKHVASGSDDMTVIIWDVDSGNLVGEPLTGHADPVLSVVYSPDGKFIASSSADETIRLWDVESGTHITIFDYSGIIRCVAYSPDGMYLASGSDSGRIQFWDTQSGDSVGQPYNGHTARVASVAYSFDGKRIVSGSDDGTIRIWEAEHATSAHDTGIDWVPPSSVRDDGWFETSEGGLLLWVPLEYRNGVCDLSSLCIPPDALGHPVSIDWASLCHGTSWIDIKQKRE